MNIKINRYLILFAIPVFIAACGGGSKDQEAELTEKTAAPDQDGGAAELSDAMKMVEESVKQLNDGKEVEVVDFRKLKELLPEKLAGMKRSTHGGEKTGAMGFKVSMAEATYEDGNSRLEVKITDAAGVGMALVGLAAWSTVEIDRETDDSYERTTVIEGHKGFEKYDGSTRQGELSLIIGDRFIVNIEGTDVDKDVFRDAVKKLDLGELEKM